MVDPGIYEGLGSVPSITGKTTSTKGNHTPPMLLYHLKPLCHLSVSALRWWPSGKIFSSRVSFPWRESVVSVFPPPLFLNKTWRFKHRGLLLGQLYYLDSLGKITLLRYSWIFSENDHRTFLNKTWGVQKTYTHLFNFKLTHGLTH